MPKQQAEAVVVGTGIAGMMTALSLLRKGCSVTVIDRWEPGHPRSASADFNRIFRAIHGKDELYTSWVRESRLRWMELEVETGAELYVECGALIIAAESHTDWEDATIPTFERLGVPHFKLPPDELAVRFPQFQFDKVAYGIFEPEAGMVMAHATILASRQLFEKMGGRLLRGRVMTDENERLTFEGKPLEADLVVCAAGAWLADMFPRTIAPISKTVRQNIIYTSTPRRRHVL